MKSTLTSDDIGHAMEIIRARGGEFDVDGELQLDAAIVPGAASAKGVAGAVAGRANILVFPGIGGDSSDQTWWNPTCSSTSSPTARR